MFKIPYLYIIFKNVKIDSYRGLTIPADNYCYITFITGSILTKLDGASYETYALDRLDYHMIQYHDL